MIVFKITAAKGNNRYTGTLLSSHSLLISESNINGVIYTDLYPGERYTIDAGSLRRVLAINGIYFLSGHWVKDRGGGWGFCATGFIKNRELTKYCEKSFLDD